MPKGVSKKLFNNFKKYYEPDVFRAAGKRIRAMARAADGLTVEERINRITTIFGTFRNPDKETVLTPWRVVNMHMGDCLGGYVFYDDPMENPLEKPRFVNQGQVTKDVFAPDARILEINSKSGLYPLYMAYSIYRSRLAADDPMGLNPTPTLEQQLRAWDSVIAENIFVICKTPMAKSITRRTLVGFRKARVNTHYFEDLINQIKNKPEQFIEKMAQGKNYWKSNNNNNNMKFNAIVGNPPYQVMDGGGTGSSAIPVYDKFVEIAKKVNPEYLSMIMPSRWFSGGRGLDDFRDKMLNDNRISKIHDFLKATDCFANVEIKGGVCYFLWDKNHNGECEVSTHDKHLVSTSKRFLLEEGVETFVRYNEAISILHNVRILNEDSFANIMSANDPFGFDVREENSYKRVKPKIKYTKFENSVEMYYNGWRKDGLGYVKSEDVSKNVDWIDKYKVLIPKAWGTGDINNDWLNPFITNPNSCCTETYLVIGPFDDFNTAKNVVSYIQTKFFHFMLLLTKNTQNAMKKVYQFVPLQDFNKPWTDSELYAKYGLSPEEIVFIESMIKVMG
jgi:hypothetical protein